MIKKGLLGHTTSIIIAVIGLLLLGAGIYKMYGIFKGEDENMKKTIDSIEGKIKRLEDGDKGKFLVRGNNKWYVTGWSAEEKGKPDKCYLNSCICICKGNIFAGDALSGESCQKKGFCRIFEEKKVIVKSDLILKAVYATGENSAEGIDSSGIIFKSNLIEIEVKKEKDSIEVSYRE
ncbi:MAG: hypothetical protein AABW65_00775 [Nanoarchaeota archaeon]